MPVIDHLDLASKRIFLAAGVREYHPVDDLYREIRSLRRTDPSLRGFDIPVTASGNLPKGGGRFTPRLVTFRDGWRVVPEDTSHTLFVTGEQITEEGGAGPDCLDLAPLAAESKVIVHYEPPAAEIITVSANGDSVWSTSQRDSVVQGVTSVKDQTDKIPTLALEATIQAVKNRTDTIEWADVVRSRRVLEGSWRILNNQLILFDSDGDTPLVTFDLLDREGNPTETAVFRRVPVG